MRNQEDRRVLRTRKMLFDALIDLMIEKGYEAVTVQDIIDRADVGRSTFYAHYYDKEQLLLANIKQLRAHLIERTAAPPPDEPEDARFRFSLVMLRHVEQNERLYHAVVGKQSGTAVMQHMRTMLAEVAREEIDRLLARGELPVPGEVATEFVVGTFLTVLSWRMERRERPNAEECDRLFHRLVFAGLSCGADEGAAPPR